MGDALVQRQRRMRGHRYRVRLGYRACAVLLLRGGLEVSSACRDGDRAVVQLEPPR